MAVRKAKQKEYSARHYQANKKKTKALTKERKRQLYEQWREFKSTLGCFACDENDPSCIDFHHVIADGKADRADSANAWIFDKSWSMERVKQEIWSTCIPLCCNCHRKVHAQHKLWVKEENEAGKRLERDT
jgi:hypothetical protein